MKYMSATFFVFQVLLSVVAIYASHLFLVNIKMEDCLIGKRTGNKCCLK